MAAGDAQIDPEDLDYFARRMDQLADDLADPQRPVSKLIKSNANHGGVIDFPCPGVFASGQAFTDAYVGKINEMAGGFQQLEGLLRSLGEATRSVAKKYRTTEEYNRATSEEIEALVGGTAPPSGNQNPGSQNSGNQNNGTPGDQNGNVPQPE
ncbi:WXG100 family type VII secretion target [Actinopolymorpha alba]|uniref:WXG100 family type VII secretion target n=1 Tax=Actinopolymorpha alba TaxID=533267 RepID=UPI0012F647DC|nr:WXG100 family type VII secretion target [Actinopolymorpha alba]